MKEPTTNEIKKSARELAILSNLNNLSDLFFEIKEKFSYYVDAPEDTQNLISLWILGTHFHKCFPTYPILYLNAMRGSGKTRTLNFISHLALGLKGSVQNSISESALFHSSGSTLCLDELEPRATEKTRLNLLLNSCYKKGALVPRMAKVKRDDKETYEQENHSLYMPVALANIHGIDAVLENRSLIVFLERSFDAVITSRIEDFNLRLSSLKKSLKTLSNDAMTQMTDMTHIIDNWNSYLDSLHNKSKTCVTGVIASFYKGIYDAGISGRNLELCFPLLIVASQVSPEIFDFSLKMFSKISKQRLDSELDEEHIMLYRFVATLDSELLNFYKPSKLLSDFKDFCAFSVQMNPTQFSMALNRLQLVLERKRTSSERLLRLDVERAKRRVGLFEREK